MMPEDYSSHRIIYPTLVQPYIQGTRLLHNIGLKLMLDGVLDKTGKYNMFDVVSFKVPFAARFDSMVQILRDAKLDTIKIVPTRKIFDEKQADDQFNRWLNESYTGMIYRLGHCLYTKPTSKNPNNRSKQLLLRKAK